MIHPKAIVLERDDVRLEPLEYEHLNGLKLAAADGELWKLWFTSVPEPEGTLAYLEGALEGQRQGHMLPWAVRDVRTNEIVGSTRYHDIIAGADRVEIGWTWYSLSRQRTSLNTLCKLMLLTHAFDDLGCKVVALRTDNFNFKSQQAIEALGARKDGVLRHHWPRRDGTVRDSVVYSILTHEWPDVRRNLEARLTRHAKPQDI